MRQWSNFHPEFSYLPRKFKIAVIATEEDRAAMRWHDIGIRIVRNDAGEVGAKFYVGGGMGRTPMIAPLHPRFRAARPVHLLPSRPACASTTATAARQQVQGADQDPGPRTGRGRIPPPGRGGVRRTSSNSARISRARNSIASRPISPPPAFEAGLSDEIDRSDPDFALWVDRQTAAHKAAGYVIVNISLKPRGRHSRRHFGRPDAT